MHLIQWELKKGKTGKDTTFACYLNLQFSENIPAEAAKCPHCKDEVADRVVSAQH